MGFCIVCYICQRITNALIYLYKCLTFEGINCLDDLGAAKIKECVWQPYRSLGDLLHNLGVWEGTAKASLPSEIMISLGVTCNSVTFTMEITLERLCEITVLVQSWLKNYRQIWNTIHSQKTQLYLLNCSIWQGLCGVNFEFSPGLLHWPENENSDY